MLSDTAVLECVRVAQGIAKCRAFVDTMMCRWIS